MKKKRKSAAMDLLHLSNLTLCYNSLIVIIILHGIIGRYWIVHYSYRNGPPLTEL